MEYTQTELRLLALCSAVGGAFSFLVGGFDLAMYSLMALICIDFTTGVYAGWVNAAVSSQRGYNGLKRKAFIIVVIAIANLLDNSMMLNRLLRNMMICGYGIIEGISIFENFDRIGWGDYIPDILRSKLIQIRDEKGFK